MGRLYKLGLPSGRELQDQTHKAVDKVNKKDVEWESCNLIFAFLKGPISTGNKKPGPRQGPAHDMPDPKRKLDLQTCVYV